jgi:hypothetical protein
MFEKLKSFIANDAIFTSILLAGVALAAFFLGRASTDDGSFVAAAVEQRGAVLQAQSLNVPVPLAPEKGEVKAPQGGQYVASKSGTKYHRADCPGAAQIKEENKVFFATPAEAEGAGYTKAANCPGL